jgi:hypothetical protein
MLRLTTVDISYNQLEGPIPTIPAFQKANIEEMRNNKDLCGNVSSLKPCPTPSGNSHSPKTNKILVLVLPLTLGTVLIALFVYWFSYHLWRTSRTKENKVAEESHTENLFANMEF